MSSLVATHGVNHVEKFCVGLKAPVIDCNLWSWRIRPARNSWHLKRENSIYSYHSGRRPASISCMQRVLRDLISNGFVEMTEDHALGDHGFLLQMCNKPMTSGRGNKVGQNSEFNE